MPAYEAICRKCNTLHDYIRPVSRYLDTPECCGQKTEKVIITAPMTHVQPNICYDSPIDGRPITTKQARIEDLKRSGCRPWEGLEQEKKEAAKFKREEGKKMEQKLEDRITQSIQQISPESRRVLGVGA